MSIVLEYPAEAARDKVELIQSLYAFVHVRVFMHTCVRVCVCVCVHAHNQYATPSNMILHTVPSTRWGNAIDCNDLPTNVVHKLLQLGSKIEVS